MKHIVLLILLTLGAWAEEVGVPYVNQDIQGNITNSVTLINDSQSFFSLNSPYLTQWNLNPVSQKKIYTGITGSKIFMVLNDKNKLVLQTKEGLAIVSLQDEKIIQQIQTDISEIIQVGEFIITLDESQKIHKWRSSNLTEISQLEIRSSTAEKDSLNILLNGSVDTEFSVLINEKLFLIDTKTMKIKKETPCYAKYIATSVDRNTLIADAGNWRSINTRTHQLDVVSSLYYVRNNPWYVVRFPGKKPPNDYYSENNNLYMVGTRKVSGFNIFSKKRKQLLATFYTFINGNWLIITPDGYFDGSHDSRKYLYMKTSSGESVPIDDATFQKYHIQIILKD